MKFKGIISFVLVLIFILIYFNLVYSINSFNSKKGFTEGTLIEIENLSFKRNLIENAVDSLIREEIRKEINFGSDDPKEINEKVSVKLMNLFSLMEKQGIEFKKIKSNKEYSETEIKGNKITKKFVEKNSKTKVINLEKKIYLVEFIYTAGINKNELIGAEIKEKNSSQKFFIPTDYSIKEITIRFV